MNITQFLTITEDGLTLQENSFGLAFQQHLEVMDDEEIDHFYATNFDRLTKRSGANIAMQDARTAYTIRQQHRQVAMPHHPVPLQCLAPTQGLHAPVPAPAPVTIASVPGLKFAQPPGLQVPVAAPCQLLAQMQQLQIQAPVHQVPSGRLHSSSKPMVAAITVPQVLQQSASSSSASASSSWQQVALHQQQVQLQHIPHLRHLQQDADNWGQMLAARALHIVHTYTCTMHIVHTYNCIDLSIHTSTRQPMCATLLAHHPCVQKTHIRQRTMIDTTHVCKRHRTERGT